MRKNTVYGLERRYRDKAANSSHHRSTRLPAVILQAVLCHSCPCRRDNAPDRHGQRPRHDYHKHRQILHLRHRLPIGGRRSGHRRRKPQMQPLPHLPDLLGNMLFHMAGNFGSCDNNRGNHRIPEKKRQETERTAELEDEKTGRSVINSTWNSKMRSMCCFCCSFRACVKI